MRDSRSPNAKLSRLFRLLQILDGCGPQPRSSEEFARLLGVTRRQFYRDLRTLRELGFDVEFDQRRKRHLLRSDFHLNAPLQSVEVLVLLLGLWAIEGGLLGQALGGAATSAIAKVSKLFSPQIVSQLCDEPHRVRWPTVPTPVGEVAGTILDALRLGRTLRVHLPLGAMVENFRCVPEALHWTDEGWTLIALSFWHRRLVQLSLAHVERVELLPEVKRPPLRRQLNPVQLDREGRVIGTA